MGVITSSNTNETKTKTKVWLNAGIPQKSSEGNEYLLSPFFGIAVDTNERKGLSQAQKQLQAAIEEKAKELGVGTHKTKLEVWLTVVSDEEQVVDTTEFKSAIV